jgi:hypothetical protein
VDASVYKIDWKDMIRNVSLPCILSFTTNLGDAWDPQSANYAGANNLFRDPAIHQGNLRIGTNFGNWDTSLFINNVTNEQPILGKGRALSSKADHALWPVPRPATGARNRPFFFE